MNMSETPERQHGLMSFISLNIPERVINLHFVNSAGLIFQSITEVIGGGGGGGGGKPRPSPTAFSLLRVGMYATAFKASMLTITPLMRFLCEEIINSVDFVYRI
jgi:hypothetical protein